MSFLKQPVFQGKMLHFRRVGDCLIKYYKVTTWFNDGSTEETEEPAHDQTIFIPRARIF